MKVTLEKIKRAIKAIKGDNWDDHTMNYLYDAISNLEKLQAALNEVKVSGRSNLDALLGCIIGLDMIIGKEEDNDG